MIIPASGALGRRSVGDTIPGSSVKTEKLSTNSVVLEARAGSSIFPALGIEAEKFAREDTWQRLLLVWRVVHTRGSLATEKYLY